MVKHQTLKGHSHTNTGKDMQHIFFFCLNHFCSRVAYLYIPFIISTHNTERFERKHEDKENKDRSRKIKSANFFHATQHTENIIIRAGRSPWEPTGVCLRGRRGQVWGHTSSVSAERRVDHTNSIMATKTAMMRPQISTTKMPPMFSMPRPKAGHRIQNMFRFHASFHSSSS